MRCYGASGYLGVQKHLEIKQNEHFSSIDFRIEYQFGYRKVVYRRLKKNENHLYALFACAILHSRAVASRKLSTTSIKEEISPFTEKEAANQRKTAYWSKDKPCILKKRLNGVFDQNAGLMIQRFLRFILEISGL